MFSYPAHFFCISTMCSNVLKFYLILDIFWHLFCNLFDPRRAECIILPPPAGLRIYQNHIFKILENDSIAFIALPAGRLRGRFTGSRAHGLMDFTGLCVCFKT